jgi:hypothetical protein
LISLDLPWFPFISHVEMMLGGLAQQCGELSSGDVIDWWRSLIAC